MATTRSRAQIADYEAAVQEDGTITGLRVRLLADIGAYPVAADIPDLTLAMGVGTYKIPAVDYEVKCVYTNTTPVAAYRSAGRPEAAYYIERLMGCIADELGMDPAELRRRAHSPRCLPLQNTYRAQPMIVVNMPKRLIKRSKSRAMPSCA